MSTDVTTVAGAPTGTRRPVAVIAVMTVAALMDLLDVTVVNVALPTLRSRLHASPTQLEWIVGGYLLAFGGTLAVWGRVGDVFGRRRVFLVAVGAFGVASLAAGTAQSVDWLIAFRVPQVLATFRTALSPAVRTTAFGVYGAVAGLAAAAGVVLGGVLTQYSLFGLGWRAIFLVNVPVAAAVLLAALAVIPESRPLARHRLPVISMITLPLSLAAIVYPLSEGRAHHWPAWMTVLGVAGIALLAVTVRIEARRQRRHHTVLLDVGQFRFPAFSCGVAVQLLFSAALQGFSLTFVLWLQVGHVYTPLHTGLTLLAFSAGAMVTAPQAGQLARSRGRGVLAAGGALLVVGTVVVSLPAWRDGAAPTMWTTLGGLFLAGAGLGLLVVPLVNVVLSAVPDEAAGGASGVFSTAQQVGGAIGVAVIGTFFFDHVSGRHLDSGFRVAVVAAALTYAAAGLLSLTLPRTAVSDEHVVEIG